MARNVLPTCILILIALGVCAALGERAGLYGSGFGNALFTLGSIILIASLVWDGAIKISKTEQENYLAQEAAQAQREWLHVMLSSIADAVIATDHSGQIQFLNPVASTLTGWPESDALGQPISLVLRLKEEPHHGLTEHPVEKILRSGKASARHETLLISKDGQVTPIENNLAPIRNPAGQVIGCVAILKDITERRRTEEIRQEIAAQYSAVAEAIPQIVWATQTDGTVAFYNKRWFDYTGYSTKATPLPNWQTALHPEDQDNCRQRWNNALQTLEYFEAEARILRHDDTYRWHLIRASPVLDRSGNVTKWFGTCTDIQDQKRAEESMRFLADASQLLSSSLEEISTLQNVAKLAVPKLADLCTIHLTGIEAYPDSLTLAAICHMDPDKVERILELENRLPPTWDDGRGIAQALKTGSAIITPEIDESFLTHIDPEHATKFRELGIHSMMVIPLRSHGDKLGILSFASMESNRRYSAEDVALAEELAARTTLALDNNRLFAEVTKTKEEAEAANAAKDQFLAVLSHELRTPLTPVLIAVDDLLRESNIRPDIREALEMTHRNIELEARLIDDLLDLTRIQRGKLALHFVATDAHTILHNSIDICKADIQSKNLQISLGLAANCHFVYADPARLQQVFWNLIKNAVKFTDPFGSIIFRSSNTSTGTLQIEVEDSGIGIEAHILPKVFDAFEQGEKSRTRRFGGLGLGLAISKNLIDAHQGKLSVHSAGRELGTKFVIELNTVDMKVAASHPGTDSAHVDNVHPSSHTTAAHHGCLKILLVEDNQETGTLLRRILERRGYQVELATTMNSAIQAANRTTFDLLISDVGLPDGSGLELMQHLRLTSQIPGIAMSGFGMDEDIRNSLEAGFLEHLIKPISIAKLEETIKGIASHARLTPPAEAEWNQ
jgi:PAS domain S-box-containing protein